MAKKVKLNRIKEILARDDKKQTWLAEQIGKSRVVVTNYVNNNTQPSLDTLFQIAKALKVNPKDLINS
ncbi:MAG TPA: helix-turn-helix domain-containing protein [Ohtaekwangia sp.]|nr:helix-turn-helix domain-containing protein [Ohtaekwangia sp.]